MSSASITRALSSAPAPEHNYVVILRGIPGSGKTTYVKSKFRTAVVCSADSFFETVPGGFDSSSLPLAHAKCLGKFVDALQDKKPVIVVDNTNVSKWEYENYEKIARLAGYEVEIYEMHCKSDSTAGKCADRNRHGVPVSKVIEMYSRFEKDPRAVLVPIGGI